MTPRTTRVLRRGLLGLFLAVGLSVAWTLRRPGRAPAIAPPSPVPSAAAGAAQQKTHQENMVYKQFKGDRESVLLKARSWVGQEQEMRFQGAEVTFTYTARGKQGQAVISSDECTYEPAPQRAVFKGNVVLRTDDGFELKTPSLLYRGDKNVAKTEDPAEFQRKDISGSSTGLVYQGGDEGRLELLNDAVIHIRDPDKPETEIRSRRATYLRNEGLMRFEEAVEVTQGRDHLKADRLNVNIGSDDVINRMQAIDEVELRTAGDLPGATIASGGRGPRVLRCKKLDVFFRPDKTVSEAVAGPDAELTIMPGPGEQPERRILRGRVLTFRFDEQGRLQELQGQKEAFFSGEALPPAQAAPRTLTCQSFLARLDPVTGEAQNIEFTRDLEFVQGGQKATAQKGWYDGAKGLLILKEKPVIVDTERGWRLAAQAIDVATRSGDIAARQEVRNTMRNARPDGQAGFLAGPDAVATSRYFEYESNTRTAHYREDALLRSGKDEVRGAEIRVQDLEGGTRRLEAQGSVASLLHPRNAEPAKVTAKKSPSPKGAPEPDKVPAPVQAHAETMQYDEAAARVIYRGEVVIRQGDIETRSPEATLNLTPDGGGLKTLVAGEPVDVKQGIRTAFGTRGTYTPDDETMVLVGEKVVLKDPSQEVQGRSLTFHVGDDRILVDGREEVRTEAVFKKESPRP